MAAYKVLSNSNNLCWTVVCPTHLIDGEATEVYRTEKDILPEGGSKLQWVIQHTLHGIYVRKIYMKIVSRYCILKTIPKSGWLKDDITQEDDNHNDLENCFRYCTA